MRDEVQVGGRARIVAERAVRDRMPGPPDSLAVSPDSPATSPVQPGHLALVGGRKRELHLAGLIRDPIDGVGAAVSIAGLRESRQRRQLWAGCFRRSPGNAQQEESRDSSLHGQTSCFESPGHAAACLARQGYPHFSPAVSKRHENRDLV